LVSSFTAAIARDLSSISPPVSLTDKTCWPGGNHTRVAESAPGGREEFWDGLLSSRGIAEALDLIVGEGRWELNKNPDEGVGVSGPRHWCVCGEGGGRGRMCGAATSTAVGVVRGRMRPSTCADRPAVGGVRGHVRQSTCADRPHRRP
jgi:hypothetical protein